MIIHNRDYISSPFARKTGNVFFCEIVNDDTDTMICALNEFGRIAEIKWIKTSQLRPNIHLDVLS